MKLYISYHTGFRPEQLKRLEEMGFDIRLSDPRRELEACPDEYTDAEAIICYRLFNNNDISRFKSLRLIHTTSAGLDHMPLEYIREKGIRLYNASGVYSIPMAEYALCGVLQLYKKMPLFAERQREHRWQQNHRLMELTGKRVLIVGSGSIGSETAKRFSAMDCFVTGLCRHPASKPFFDTVRSIDELEAVLPESDVVIACLPLSDDTRHMFNDRRFALMKPGTVFVNMARGPITDTAALLRALESERLLGAVIDVCEQEPLPPESELWSAKNCILTPHNSFSSDGNNDRLFELICRDFGDYLKSDSFII